MPSIFISHSSKDKAFAKKLVQTLEEHGLDTWMDSDDIRAGIKWSSAIQEGLNQGSLMVVILSPDSMQSKNVEDEWQYYIDKHKPIVPILYKATDNIHFQLARIQYVDFVSLPYDEGIKRLISELRHHHIDVSVSDSPKPNPQPRIPTQTSTNNNRNIAIGSLVGLVLIAILLLIAMNPGPNNPIQTSTPASENTPTEAATIEATQVVEATEIPTDSPTLIPEQTNRIMVDVPYVSQFGTDAPFTHDDGPAALLMILKWYAQSNPDSATASRVRAATVQDVSIQAGMTAESNFVTISGLLNAANDYKLPVEFCRNISRERMFEELDNDRPVLVLVDFDKLRPDLDFIGGHTTVLVAYDAENVILYDPHNGSSSSEEKVFTLPYDVFDDIIVNIPQNQAVSQALIFGEDNDC